MWCIKCHWSRFCRGCPIDAYSEDSIEKYQYSDSLILDKVDKNLNTNAKENRFILVVDWKPEVLHLKYDYSDDIVSFYRTKNLTKKTKIFVNFLVKKS